MVRVRRVLASPAAVQVSRRSQLSHHIVCGHPAQQGQISGAVKRHHAKFYVAARTCFFIFFMLGANNSNSVDHISVCPWSDHPMSCQSSVTEGLSSLLIRHRQSFYLYLPAVTHAANLSSCNVTTYDFLDWHESLEVSRGSSVSSFETQ